MIYPIHTIHTEIVRQAAQHPTESIEQIQQRSADALGIDVEVLRQAIKPHQEVQS